MKKPLSLLMVALVAVGCGSSAKVLSITDKTYPPCNGPVKVFFKPPQCEYEEIAVVSATGTGGGLQLVDLVAIMREKAASIGANGLIIGSATSTADGFTIEGASGGAFGWSTAHKDLMGIAIRILDRAGKSHTRAAQRVSVTPHVEKPGGRDVKISESEEQRAKDKEEFEKKVSRVAERPLSEEEYNDIESAFAKRDADSGTNISQAMAPVTRRLKKRIGWGTKYETYLGLKKLLSDPDIQYKLIKRLERAKSKDPNSAGNRFIDEQIRRVKDGTIADILLPTCAALYEHEEVGRKSKLKPNMHYQEID